MRLYFTSVAFRASAGGSDAGVDGGAAAADFVDHHAMPRPITATPRSSRGRSRARSTATPMPRPSAARSSLREGAAAARHRAGRPGRHAGLEHLAPFRALLRHLRHRRGLPHDQPAAVRRPDRLHRQPRRTTGSCSSTPASSRWSSGCAALAGGLPDRAATATAETSLPGDRHCYDELIAAEDDDFAWPEFDERTASALCYTSGTTGNPKGVLYSHRSTVLHALGASLPGAIAVSAATTSSARSCRCSTPAAGAPPIPRR